MTGLPDFLGIGAPRAGTTWLHDVLSHHPDVFLPPVKEVHYFDVLDSTVDRRSFRYRGHLRSRVAGTLAHFVPSLTSKLGSEEAIFCPGWDLKYFLGPANDRWYSSLFEAAKSNGKICGEITPSYSLLSKNQIEHILRINPDMKFVYILRDPVERAWSHAVKVLSRETGISIEDVELSQFEAFYRSGENIRVGSYAQNIQCFRSVIDSDQLLVLFYEDIALQSEKLLMRLCEFLGCDLHSDTMSRSHRKVNSSAKGRSIPAEHLELLSEIYVNDLTSLAEMFEGYPLKWLAKARGRVRD